MLELTKYDYGYLKGDLEMWPSWGAAYGLVMEFCRNAGFGEFGKPTERGKKMIEEYERSQVHDG